MADLQGRKVFKVFNQDFIVDEQIQCHKGAWTGRLRYRLVGIFPMETEEGSTIHLLTWRHAAPPPISRLAKALPIKKVTNVFSKKILAKRALREIKLLQHFRGHRNVRRISSVMRVTRADTAQITCLYDMDIPRPDNFNETYLYEGE